MQMWGNYEKLYTFVMLWNEGQDPNPTTPREQDAEGCIMSKAIEEIQTLRVRVEALEPFLKTRELPQHEDSCQWKEDEDGIWNTGCGNLFEFTADGPTENQFRFCPYCGGKILICEETQE